MRYAKIDNSIVSDLFDGQNLGDLQAAYPESIFQEADSLVTRGWGWNGTAFIDPTPPPSIPTNAQIELLIRAERDRLESLATANWGPEQKEILFTRISAEIDGRRSLMADIPIMKGIAKAFLNKSDPTDTEVETVSQIVIFQVERLAEYAQRLTMGYQFLVEQIPTLTDTERINYNAADRFLGILAQ